jgi:hypothetical protein
MKTARITCGSRVGWCMLICPTEFWEEEAVRSIIDVRWQMRRANLVDSELFQIYRFYKGEDRGVGTSFAHDAAQANA